MHYTKVLEDPDLEDSLDLSNEEIAQSVMTRSGDEWVARLATAVKVWRVKILRHEMRRRGTSLFIRTQVQFADGAEQALIARTDWLGGSP